MRQELLKLNKHYHIHHYDGITDAAAYAVDKWDEHVQQHKDTLHLANRLGRSFTSIQQCAEALSQPWEEGMKLFDNCLKEIDQHNLKPPLSLKRKTTWSDDDGDEICLDRLRHSQPYWRTTKREHRPGPANITIAIDLFSPGFVGPQELMWRGVATTVLTKLLEEAGYRISIIMADPSSDAYFSGKGHVSVIELKRPHDPLDICSMINCLSAWCYRTIYFSTMVHEGEQLQSSMGIRCQEDVLSHIITDPTSLICSGIFHLYESTQWIKQQLEKFASGEFAAQP